MVNVSPSKDFIEKMKAGHKSKGKFGKMKKKGKTAKKGFKAFAKKSTDDSDEDGM